MHPNRNANGINILLIKTIRLGEINVLYPNEPICLKIKKHNAEADPVTSENLLTDIFRRVQS
jgi:hypothetical protein